MADATLSLGGRTFRPAEGAAVTFRRHRYAMRHAAEAGMHHAPADAHAFLVQLYGAGNAGNLLAAGLVEVRDDGRGPADVPFTDAWADEVAAFVDGLTGEAAVVALTEALTVTVVPFFTSALRASSTTSPSSSTAPTDSGTAPSGAAVAHSTSGTGSPSSARSRGRRPRSRPSSAGPSARGSSPTARN